MRSFFQIWPHLMSSRALNEFWMKWNEYSAFGLTIKLRRKLYAALKLFKTWNHFAKGSSRLMETYRIPRRKKTQEQFCELWKLSNSMLPSKSSKTVPRNLRTTLCNKNKSTNTNRVHPLSSSFVLLDNLPLRNFSSQDYKHEQISVVGNDFFKI